MLNISEMDHFHDWLKNELDAMIDQNVSIKVPEVVPEVVPSPRGFGPTIKLVGHIGKVLNSRVTLVAPKNVKYPVYKCELRILNKDGKKEWLTLNDAYLKVL